MKMKLLYNDCNKSFMHVLLPSPVTLNWDFSLFHDRSPCFCCLFKNISKKILIQIINCGKVAIKPKKTKLQGFDKHCIQYFRQSSKVLRLVNLDILISVYVFCYLECQIKFLKAICERCRFTKVILSLVTECDTILLMLCAV